MLFISAILFITIFNVESIEVSNNVCSIPSDFRFDCNPDDPSNKETCESRGCCWYPNKDDNGSPKCFFPTNYQGYVIKGIENRKNGVTVRLTRNSSSGLPQDVSNVNLEVIGLDNERVRIRFVDADASRFEVPMPFLNVSQSTINSPLYSIKINRDTGNLQVSRQSTGTSIFNVDLSKLIYANQFIQLSSLLVNNFLYGLGEHKDTFRKTIDGWKRYTLFAGGTNPTENINLYASYPFYLMIEPDNQAHGVFLLNSNAMDIITQPAPAITWRTIGGILDFFIFLGPTAPQVIRQNVNLIGRPVMQPYWSLGFHLCRYDYKSTNKTRETFFRNIQAGIPIETQWNDIDYMDRYNDFTVDPVNFAGLSDFVNELHSMRLHYVLIMDAGVSGSEPPGSYPPLDDGKKDDIFIKNKSGEIFLGRVWNFETTAFPDFTNPATLNYWTKQFIDLKNQVDYDGVWIDMNEPYNFHQIMPCPNNSYEYPPYTPGIQPLNNNTICMSCKQHGGLHYDVHSLFGLLETVATYEAVKNITGIRPFILSRSTFPSQGHYGSHWSGDIRSTWDFMKYSISNMLEFNIYGIPMIGSDICGFAGNTTEQLCMRWSSLGAFYPFSRNHNDFDTIEQDPVALGPKVVAATKYAVNLRYRLLPYLYTLFHEAHTKGDTVARPIFFEFPLDVNTYSIETSFMWGSGILIVPILEPDTKTVNAYFPEGFWYDFESLKLSVKSTGRYENITIDDDKIGVYARGGSIIPGYLVTAMSIADLSELPGYLFIFLDSSGQASGSWFSDDGQSIENIQNGEYTYSHCKASLNKISCDYENVFTANNFKIGGIMLVGVDKKPTSVLFNGTQIDSYFYSDENHALKIDSTEVFERLQSFNVDLSYN
ncbi:lysosomal alpha-glucosidase-like [Tetranychus urticae]|uniref:P-type domain-containing protein n=1 Tax=Tetranychus urticae TaxID=32264 RepID=T1L0N1_TETUR|nr:lysosomal alpha-glucosidase-like [Tetranychus urticae]